MTWERDEDRLALLELVRTGKLQRRTSQAYAWERLGELPWVRRTGRRDELALDERHRDDVVQLLDRVWPNWREHDEALAQAGLPATPAGHERLLDDRRAAALGTLPERLNIRTATSAVGPHSKATLGVRRREALGDTEISRDGVVRMRPPSGLEVVRGSVRLRGDAIAELLGEVAITERALRDGTRIEGPVRAVLLVENLGPYQDLTAPAGWLVAHVPGWNTATVRVLLEQLGEVPIVHFGDLDPAGFRIVQHLRSIRADLRWAVPDFWAEFVESRGLRGEWPEELDLGAAPTLVRELAARGRWLEQEVVALDSRLATALEDTLT